MGGMAYLTDCSSIPPASLDLLQDLEVLILGVVRYEPHPTHMHVEQALQLVNYLGRGRLILPIFRTYSSMNRSIGRFRRGVSLAYDHLKSILRGIKEEARHIV